MWSRDLSNIPKLVTQIPGWLSGYASWTCYFYTELIRWSPNWSRTFSSLFWVHWSISEKTLVTAQGLGLFVLCSPSELMNWYSGCHFRSWLMAPVPFHPSPLLSHLYCCLQVSTVVHNYHFCLPAGSQPEDKLYEETPPLCTSKSSELINVAFQGSTQQTLNEWRPCSPNSISETAGWSPASDSGDITMPRPCLAGSDFSPFCQA